MVPFEEILWRWAFVSAVVAFTVGLPKLVAWVADVLRRMMR